ncbi:AI-2E family transporter [Ferrovibrio sp.]|uniref:AI-2E family transporter n=1 Tax=Ferrovibrio sp. TaxID=1917215 RepID=UPI003516B4F6
MTARQQWIAWGVILTVFILMLVLLRGILLPFVAAMAIAYLLDPVADRLEARGLSRTLATLLIIALFFAAAIALVLVLVPVVQHQLDNFIAHLPRYAAAFRETVLPYLQGIIGRLGIDLNGDVKQAIGSGSGQAMKVLDGLIAGLLGGGAAIFNLLSLLVVTPVVSFYLLRDWDRMVARIDAFLPLDHAETIREQVRKIDQVLAGFVRGQMLVCLILGGFYAIGLSLAGLQFGLFIGLSAGAISFIPYVGTGLGFLVSIGVALAQFWPDWIWIAVVAGIFALGQFLEGNFITPKLVGDRVGLHPVWIMFGLFAGGALFGFLGMLLAVPVAAVIGVLTRYTLQRYRDSHLFHGGRPPAQP